MMSFFFPSRKYLYVPCNYTVSCIVSLQLHGNNCFCEDFHAVKWSISTWLVPLHSILMMTNKQTCKSAQHHTACTINFLSTLYPLTFQFNAVKLILMAFLDLVDMFLSTIYENMNNHQYYPC